ncbi:MAG: radical SAM protein [Gemmatimonadales bacterium]
MIDLRMVYPSRYNETRGEELLYSPLALAYVARHTPDHYRITLDDEYVGEKVDAARLKADLVAFSPITPGISRAYELADELRSRGITCVSGGAHVTALPHEALEHFDAVIAGEGEGPWRELLEDFEAGRLRETYFGRMDVPLDDLGTPRRDLIHGNYEYPSVMTSRGCPYHCSFCYLTVFKHRKYRAIPHDTVLADFESVRDYPVVVVTDENFMGYGQDAVEDRKILELLDLMYRSGCRAVFLGFEATDEDALKEVNQRQNLGVNYKKAVRTLHDHNIGVIASFILGMDAHDKGYPDRLIRDLQAADADFPRIFLMTAWPGTPLFDRLEKEGRASRDWDRVRKDMPSIQFKHFTHDEIVRARQEILDAFFNVFSISRKVARWMVKDRSILLLFVRMSFRNRVSERIKQLRRRRLRPVAGRSEPLR